MSIKSFFYNLFGVEKKDVTRELDKRMVKLEGYLGPSDSFSMISHLPTCDECRKCGGFFKLGSLNTVTEVNVVTGAKKGPATHTIFSSFCNRCKPPLLFSLLQIIITPSSKVSCTLH